jgi:hypothetical protein
MRKDRRTADQYRPAARTLQESRGDQRPDAVGQAADQRSEPEQDQADDEDALASIAVAQRADRHQHRGAGERVGIHDPLHLREIRMQLALQRRQDHRHAGYLQTEHQGRQGNGHQGGRAVADADHPGSGVKVREVAVQTAAKAALSARRSNEGND